MQLLQEILCCCCFWVGSGISTVNLKNEDGLLEMPIPRILNWSISLRISRFLTLKDHGRSKSCFPVCWIDSTLVFCGRLWLDYAKVRKLYCLSSHCQQPTCGVTHSRTLIGSCLTFDAFCVRFWYSSMVFGLLC